MPIQLPAGARHIVLTPDEVVQLIKGHLCENHHLEQDARLVSVGTQWNSMPSHPTAAEPNIPSLRIVYELPDHTPERISSGFPS